MLLRVKVNERWPLLWFFALVSFLILRNVVVVEVTSDSNNSTRNHLNLLFHWGGGGGVGGLLAAVSDRGERRAWLHHLQPSSVFTAASGAVEAEDQVWQDQTRGRRWRPETSVGKKTKLRDWNVYRELQDSPGFSRTLQDSPGHSRILQDTPGFSRILLLLVATCKIHVTVLKQSILCCRTWTQNNSTNIAILLCISIFLHPCSAGHLL